jgi:hypothetical protein
MQVPSDSIGRLLIGAGIVLIVLGALFVWGRAIRFGSLPGDFTWSGRGWQISIPLVSCLVLSLVLTIILNLVARRR